MAYNPSTDSLLTMESTNNTTLLVDSYKEISAIHIDSVIASTKVESQRSIGIQDSLLEMGLYGSPKTEISPSSTQLNGHYIVQPGVNRGVTQDTVKLFDYSNETFMINDSMTTTLLTTEQQSINAIRMDNRPDVLGIGMLETDTVSTVGIQEILLPMGVYGSPQTEISPSSVQLFNHYIVAQGVRPAHPHNLLVLEDKALGGDTASLRLLLAGTEQTVFNIAAGRKVATGEQYWA